MKGKRGEATKPISTLNKLLIVVVVISIVILGWTGKAEGLIENLEGKANEALILLNLKEEPKSNANCNPRKLDSLKGGTEFLEELELDEETKKQATFTICGSECKIDLPNDKDNRVSVKEGIYGSFRIEENLIGPQGERIKKELAETAKKVTEGGNTPGGLTLKDYGYYFTDTFDLYYANDWRKYDYILKSENIQKAEELNNLYNTIYESLNEKELTTIKNYYDNRYTKRLIFHGEPTGIDASEEHTFLIWQNGIWSYHIGTSNDDGKFGYQKRIIDLDIETLNYIGPSIATAFSRFEKTLNDGISDDVKWWWGEEFLADNNAGAGGYGGKSISTLTGGDEDVDTDEEEKTLLEKLPGMLREEIEKTQPTNKEIEEIKEILKEKTITWKNKEYKLEFKEPYMITIKDKEENTPYALRFNPFVRAWFNSQGRKEGSIKTNHLAIEIIEKQKEGWSQPTDIHQDDIRLSKEHFKEFKKIRTIKDFLTTQCR